VSPKSDSLQGMHPLSLEYRVTWGDGEVGDDVEDEGGFTGEFGKGFFKGI